MTVFNIVSRNRPPMQVEGEKVAEAIGSFHTMMVIETKDGYIGVLRMEYGNFNRQIASKGKNKTAPIWNPAFNSERMYAGIRTCRGSSSAL